MFGFHKEIGNFLVAEDFVAFLEELSSMELISELLEL
jgi:hypothetical protein